MKKIASLLVFLVFLAVGCATSGPIVAGAPATIGKGFPPEIVSAYFEPREPTLIDSVYLVINYKDPDGDAVNANLYYVITAPGGYMRVVYNGLLTKPETAGLIKGQKEGLAKIFLGSKWRGKPTLVVKLYLVDAKGNKSSIIKQEVSIIR